MARFDRLTLLNAVLADGLVPLFYSSDPALAKNVLAALAAGGSRVLEFTNRGDFAIEVFSELVKYAAGAHPDMIVGVGTVDDAATAALYIAHGANFVVGPTFNEEIARVCNRRKIAYVPGVGTLTEIARAEEFGAEIVKLFPADAINGQEFVRAALAPRPWTRIMPTGGVSPDEANLRAWFGAGVACVGMGSKLIRGEWLKAGDFAALSEYVSATLRLIQTIRA